MSSASLRKFVPREPRYTLRPGDNSHMRFAPDAEPKNIHSSKVLNLSATGASFVVSRQHAPFIFDRIRIELPLGNTSIAWWAKVVRVEQHKEHRWFKKDGHDLLDEVIVAVQFEAMPVPHANRLQTELRKKFREVDKLRKKQALSSLRELWSHYTFEVLFYLAIIATAVWLMWMWSQPTKLYNPKGGPSWEKMMWYSE